MSTKTGKDQPREKAAMAERRRTDQISTLGSDGQSYEVVEYTEFINVSSHDTPPGQRVPRPGLKDYWTTTGRKVNKIDADTWRTVDGGITLHRVILRGKPMPTA
jgi:hypothetical protein